MLRVLKPGGRFVIAGEPTRIGDRYARRLGRLTWKATTTVTQLPPLRDTWARPKEELDESSRAAALEAVVDLHTFDPDELARTALRAGAVGRRTPDRGADRGLPRLAGPHLRGRRQPGALGWGWAHVRLRLLEAAVRRGPASLGQGRARAVLLQRRRHRREAGLTGRRVVGFLRQVGWVVANRAYGRHHLLSYLRMARAVATTPA